MTDDVVARARSGDEQAFAELVGPYRRELHLHCYRLLGSLTDAEDVLPAPTRHSEITWLQPYPDTLLDQLPQPAFGYYLAEGGEPLARPAGMVVLTLRAGRLAGVTRFLDDRLLARFGLPAAAPTAGARDGVPR